MYCSRNILIAICVCNVYVQTVHGVCDSNTEFTCVEGTCILKTYQNDGIRDCPDNSDEGHTQRTECKDNAFFCTTFISKQESCITQTYVLDGRADCADGVDEFKHRIGDRCMSNTGDLYSPTCDDASGIGDGAVCDPTSKSCQCKSGYVANARQTECVKRKIGESCSVNSDCTDAVTFSTCDSGLCQCIVGYKADSTNTICATRKLGESCQTSIDCTTFNPNSECSTTDNICECTSDYVLSSDQKTCVEKRECNDATEFACRSGECIPKAYFNDGIRDCLDNTDEGDAFDCPRGDEFKCNTEGAASCVTVTWTNDGIADCTDGSDEFKHYLNVKCANDDDTLHVPACNDPVNGMGDGVFCDLTTRTCQCLLGWVANSRNTKCAKRKLYEACSVPDDCSAVIQHSTCDENLKICRCDWGYMSNNVTYDVCTKRVLGDHCNIQPDCTTFIPYAECSNKKCRCSFGLVANEENTNCLIATTARPRITEGTEPTVGSVILPNTTTAIPYNVTEAPYELLLEPYQIALVILGIFFVFLVGIMLFLCCASLAIICCHLKYYDHQLRPSRTQKLVTQLEYDELTAILPKKNQLAPIAHAEIVHKIKQNNWVTFADETAPPQNTPNDSDDDDDEDEESSSESSSSDDADDEFNQYDETSVDTHRVDTPMADLFRVREMVSMAIQTGGGSEVETLLTDLSNMSPVMASTPGRGGKSKKGRKGKFKKPKRGAKKKKVAATGSGAKYEKK